MTRVLTGDIGGTRSRFAILRLDGPNFLLEATVTFFNAKHRSFAEAIANFLCDKDKADLRGAAFGIAGVEVGGEISMTNLPWRVSREAVANFLDCDTVLIMNDMKMMAHGLLALQGSGLVCIRKGVERMGNQAVISVGTGLGEAFLVYDKGVMIPVASEGGHADFAPKSDEHIEILRFAQTMYTHVSWERVCSGRYGFPLLYEFLTTKKTIPVPDWVEEAVASSGAGPALSQAAKQGEPIGLEAMRLFAELLGAEAGNLVLNTMAVGGVFIASRAVRENINWFYKEDFLSAFAAKGRFSELLYEVPVYVITEPNCALLGGGEALRRHCL